MIKQNLYCTRMFGQVARNLLLALLLPWVLVSATPAKAAVQMVGCSGGGLSTTTGSLDMVAFLYDHSAGSCTAVADNNMFFIAADQIAFRGILGTRIEDFYAGPIGLNDYTNCQIGVGETDEHNGTPGNSCQSERNIDRTETATLTRDYGAGVIVVMTVQYTVSGTNSVFTVDSGVVAITTPDPAGPTAQDKTHINSALSNAFDAFTPGLLNGLPSSGGANTGGTGLSFASTDSNNLSFAMDLANMLASAHKDDGLALGYAGSGAGRSALDTPFNSWLTGNYVQFNDDTVNADRDGHVWIVSGGLSYDMDGTTTIGVLGQYRDGKADSSALSATLETNAIGAGAFVTTQVLGGVNIAVATMFESGDNDISIGGVTGSYDSQQISLEVNVDGRVAIGATSWLQPAVGLAYAKSTADDYTDSSSTLVKGIDSTTGTLTYGLTIGTAINGGDVAILPFAKVGGIWNFDNDGDLTTSTAGTFVAAEQGANLGAGVAFVFGSGIVLNLEADWYRFDSALDGWSVTTDLGIPLRAMGIEADGDIALAMVGKADNASATAALKMPLN